MGGVGLLAAGVPAVAGEPLPGFDLAMGARRVNLFRPASREHLSIEYLREGQWAPSAYPQLCWLLRDVRAGQYAQMDPTLIAILDWTQQYLSQYGYEDPVHVLSGYRTVQTNEKTEGAVRNSHHLYGKAVDIRIPGLPTAYLGKLMAWLSKGGVGVYSHAEFVHVDTGRVRVWRH